MRSHYAFDRTLSSANHADSLAEGIGPSGGQLGDFPEAFTHLTPVAAVLALDQQLDRARR
ncbi:hypothetical protein J5Y04_27320 [Kitasatospora sp. RG8]|uniref:hypothetical protein n=1 Tax=Kitasatospora sp. RG8 TaxID=2820815 RepID=UPI001AE0E71D|nr:hypothetical protein [Kitasatospora sp. RG8]MBP0453226.1 hypothetical protein [Kitasatospora sp. RG8]